MPFHSKVCNVVMLAMPLVHCRIVVVEVMWLAWLCDSSLAVVLHVILVSVNAADDLTTNEIIGSSKQTIGLLLLSSQIR